MKLFSFMKGKKQKTALKNNTNPTTTTGATTEPVSQHKSSPELVSQHNNPEPASQHKSSPELVSQHVSSPEPVSQHKSSPEPVSQHESSPEPPQSQTKISISPHIRGELVCDWDAVVASLHYLSSKELLDTMTVCKEAYNRVNQNDTLWRRLCRQDGGKEAIKLPTHSWKDAYKQIVLHKREMAQEAINLNTRFFKWVEMQAGYACGMRSGPPVPKSRKLEEDINPTALPGGFKKHPSSKIEPVLPFSRDLIQDSQILMELLIRSHKNNALFKDNTFLSKAMQRYINFMRLKQKHKNIILIPTFEIEYIWVSHMLRPSAYIADCTKLFGEVIDHDIYLRSAYNCLNKANSLKVTAELYQKEYDAQYCNDEIIQKYLDVQQHFNLTGCAPLEPSKDDKLTDDGAPFRSPYRTVEVTLAPSFIANIPIELVNATIATEKLGGLTTSDIIMDHLWLKEFEKYMKCSVNTPINPSAIVGKAMYTDEYDNNAKMSTKEIFECILKAYEKFLFMAAKYPPSKGSYVHPSYAIDIIWHSHMISPKVYVKEVTEWVGYLVDHEPWPDCDKTDMDASSANTEDLWRKEFGVDMNEEHITRVYSEKQNDEIDNDDSWDM